MPVLGGPVQRDRGFVLHRPAADFSRRCGFRHAALTTRAVRSRGDGKGRARTRLPGIALATRLGGRTARRRTAAERLADRPRRFLIFELPFEQRWRAARLLGVELSRISTQAGRA
jgi:putative transcriptional regulator